MDTHRGRKRVMEKEWFGRYQPAYTIIFISTALVLTETPIVEEVNKSREHLRQKENHKAPGADSYRVSVIAMDANMKAEP